jgi:hypothetical protein
MSELLPIAASSLVTLPASPPTPATETTAAHQPKQQKKHHRANEGVDDQGNDPGAKMDANPRQQPVADKCADQANNQVTDQSKAAAFHDSAGEPSGDNADDQYDEKTLIGQIHGRPPSMTVIQTIYRMGRIRTTELHAVAG